jgi:hypothetical protein
MHFAGQLDSPSAARDNVVIRMSSANGMISVSHGVERRVVNLPRCTAHTALA